GGSGTGNAQHGVGIERCHGGLITGRNGGLKPSRAALAVACRYTLRFSAMKASTMFWARRRQAALPSAAGVRSRRDHARPVDASAISADQSASATTVMLKPR